jgi:hypothetical protein
VPEDQDWVSKGDSTTSLRAKQGMLQAFVVLSSGSGAGSFAVTRNNRDRDVSCSASDLTDTVRSG